MMKKSLVCALLISILSVFITGCATLQQNNKPLESKTAPTVPKEIQADSNNFSANYYYLESRIHIKNNDYKNAIISLEKAMAKDPGSFFLTRDLSQLYLKQNNETKALELAENLIRQNPDNVDGLLFFIQLKKDAMDEKNLVDMLNRILSLDPDNKETFLRLAKIYIDNKNYTEALTLLKKMVVRFPDYYVAWFYLGEVYLAEKQYELAKIQYLKTIEIEPDIVEPRFQLITIFEIENTPESLQKTIETFEEILEIEPGNYRAQLGRALHHYKNNNKETAAALFTELGQNSEQDSRIVMMAVTEYLSGKKPEDAVIVFSQMLKGDPENQSLNFFAGMAYEETGDFTNAVSHYLKIKPGHSQYKKTILTIAFLLQKSGKSQEAITYLEDRYKELPKDIDITIYLASFYEKKADWEKAMSLLKKGLENYPENTSLLFRLGAAQDSAGLKQDGINTMKKIIEIDPKDASALNYLGYSWADLGINLDEALLLIKRAHEIKPEDGYIIDSLGWVHFKRGEYDKAVEYLEKAAELTSFETIISDHLGDAYQQTKQFKKALDAYKRAITNAKDGDKEKIVELKKKIEAVKKKIK